MIIANFINKQDALVTGLDQYDYGQVLRIQGLKLPTAVEIHFGLEETGGTTTTRIGVTKDGVTDVPIPDSMLENGDTSLDYTIYAFIYLTDETSGKTVHRIRMQVKARSKPELLNKPEDKELFQKAIEAVNQSAKEAEGWAHGREDMPERATDNAKYYAGESAKSAESVKGVEQNVKDMVATIGGIEQQVQDAKEYVGQAKTAAENALLSEQEAKKSEETSLQHRTGAETAENNAELAESNAKKSEQAIEQAKQLVMQMGQEVLNNKNHVDGKVEAFNKTVKDASDAIETAKTDAVNTIGTKGTQQIKKVSDEGEKQLKAVADKGAEVLQSIPKDFITQMESKLNKQQGVENKGKALVVGDDGNVVVGEVTGGDGIPIINTMSGESPLVVPDSAERVNKGFSLIGKSEQLTTTGKNLFDVTKVMDLKRYEPSSYGYIGFPINVEPGKTYTFNRNKKNGYGLGTKYKCGLKTDINGTIDNWLINNESEGLNFEKKTIVAKTDKIYFCTLETVTDEELSTIIKTCFLNPQLELGNIKTTYEPYTGGKPSPSPDYPQEIKSVGKWNPETQKYEVDIKVTNAKESWDKEQTLIITSDRPITKWDKLVEQDGQIGWLYNTEKYIVTGSEDFKTLKSYNVERSIDYSFNNIKQIGSRKTGENFCNSLMYVDAVWEKTDVGFGIGGNEVHIRLAYETIGSNKDEDDSIKKKKFIDYLTQRYDNGAPIIFYHKSKDTEFIPLPQSEQDAIRALKTYYPTTVITVDGAEVNPDIEVSYIADTKNYIDQKIAAIGKTVVETQKALL